MSNENIERRIIIGLIASTEFIQQIQDIWSIRFIESSSAKRIASWCMEYFGTYQKAPEINIEGIYFQKLKEGLPKDLGEDIAEILEDLSEDFIQEKFNVKYLVDQTKQYFNEKHLQLHLDKVKALIENNEPQEAGKEAAEFKPLLKDGNTAIHFSDKTSLETVERAFGEAQEPLIVYPKQLGHFWNHHLVRGGFIAFQASEKRGKTFLLMDLVRRAAAQKVRCAFFQAGDMTEAQQIRRFCIHLAKTSDMERYCGPQYQVVRDCVHNQRDTCDKKERECDFGIFEHKSIKEIREEITFDELKDALKEYPEYRPCYNCNFYKTKPWGTPWFQKINVKGPLSKTKAVQIFEDYFIKKKRQIMLSTHANRTLTIKEIESLLDLWERQRGFVPDVIVIDYADLLVPETKEFRHGQNEIWMNLRGMAQKRNCLLVTATQADAKSYSTGLLKLDNFSEDKRKYAHVTAMFGLNQDPGGREKKIGLMRINEMVAREGDFHYTNAVTVLQNLKRGLPYIGSYY